MIRQQMEDKSPSDEDTIVKISSLSVRLPCLGDNLASFTMQNVLPPSTLGCHAMMRCDVHHLDIASEASTSNWNNASMLWTSSLTKYRCKATKQSIQPRPLLLVTSQWCIANPKRHDCAQRLWMCHSLNYPLFVYTKVYLKAKLRK